MPGTCGPQCRTIMTAAAFEITACSWLRVGQRGGDCICCVAFSAACVTRLVVADASLLNVRQRGQESAIMALILVLTVSWTAVVCLHCVVAHRRSCTKPSTNPWICHNQHIKDPVQQLKVSWPASISPFIRFNAAWERYAVPGG